MGDVAGHAAFITAILDNDEIQAKRLLAGSTKESRLMMLQSQLHSGQSAVHISVMFNRVWALKLLRQQGVDLSVPLRCNTHVSRAHVSTYNLPRTCDNLDASILTFHGRLLAVAIVVRFALGPHFPAGARS